MVKLHCECNVPGQFWRQKSVGADALITVITLPRSKFGLVMAAILLREGGGDMLN